LVRPFINSGLPENLWNFSEPAVSGQYLDILTSFFKGARDPALADQLGGLLSHRHWVNFITDGARATQLGMLFPNEDGKFTTESSILLVLDSIHTGLEGYLERPLPREKRPDLLFYAAAFTFGTFSSIFLH
jgi:hypothetical protein